MSGLRSGWRWGVNQQGLMLKKSTGNVCIESVHLKFLSVTTQTGLEDTEGREKLRRACFETKCPELFVSLLRLKLGKEPRNPPKSKNLTEG